MVVHIVFGTVADVPLGDNGVPLEINANEVHLERLVCVLELAVGMNRLLWCPVLGDTDTFAIVTHGPFTGEAVGLAFWPVFPVLLVDLSIIPDTTQTGA